MTGLNKYQRLLFIGARGNFKKIPFEVLGYGEVNYKIFNVGDPEDYDDINKTFLTVEYYCLANNGQTWYFAVSDSEVYYCRQLDANEVSKLKQELQIDEAVPFDIEKFSKSSLITLSEFGKGNLAKADGRGIRDLHSFNDFQYCDFKNKFKSYSVDVFPDGTIEWFETVWVPQNEMVEIFQDSLRLGDPKSKALLDQINFFKKFSKLTIYIALALFILPFILSFFTVQTYEKKQEILPTKNQEIIFENIKIDQPNRIYNFTILNELKSDRGINYDLNILDQNENVLNNSTQEFGSGNSLKTVAFYPDKENTYKVVLKINDYGKTGTATTSKATTEFIENEKIKITIKLDKNPPLFLQWFSGGIVSLLLSGLAWIYNQTALKPKIWKI